AGGRDLGHAVASATDVGPELLDAVGVRVAPGETDDGDVRALVAGVGAVLAGREDGLEGGLPLGGGRGSREWPRLGAPRPLPDGARGRPGSRPLPQPLGERPRVSPTPRPSE